MVLLNYGTKFNLYCSIMVLYSISNTQFGNFMVKILHMYNIPQLSTLTMTVKCAPIIFFIKVDVEFTNHYFLLLISKHRPVSV